MACNSATLSGLTLDCETSKGGIKTVWVAKYSEAIATAVAAVAETADTIAMSAITAADSAATWYKYEFKRNTGSMTSTLNVDEANGTNYVSTDVVLQFSRMEAKKRAEMKALTLSETHVIVLDCNNKAWFLGANEAVTASAGTGQTGTAKTDGNYYQLTLQANDDSYPIEVSGTLPA